MDRQLDRGSTVRGDFCACNMPNVGSRGTQIIRDVINNYLVTLALILSVLCVWFYLFCVLLFIFKTRMYLNNNKKIS